MKRRLERRMKPVSARFGRQPVPQVCSESNTDGRFRLPRSVTIVA